MSDANRNQYSDAITEFSERELQQLLEIAAPPVCLLGGWAVHLHVTDAFQAEHGRQYIGSRDIDLGVQVDPGWDVATLHSKPVATTLTAVECEMAFKRGRFGFYQYFHRTTKERLSDEEASEYPRHEIFRVDVDILPSTEDLDAFEEAFGFRPPAEPLLEPVFTDGDFQVLDEFVERHVPPGVRLASRAILAAMKVRAFPDRDKSHKREKDLCDLHALLWYGSDFSRLQPEVDARLTGEDIDRFRAEVTEELFESAALLIDVDPDVLQSSIQQMVV